LSYPAHETVLGDAEYWEWLCDGDERSTDGCSCGVFAAPWAGTVFEPLSEIVLADPVAEKFDAGGVGFVGLTLNLRLYLDLRDESGNSVQLIENSDQALPVRVALLDDDVAVGLLHECFVIFEKYFRSG
jgi:hypothetical protein